MNELLLSLNIIIFFVLSSSPSSIKITKTLLDVSQNFEITSSQFNCMQIEPIDPQTMLTILVPNDHTFGDASAVGYKFLPVENKYFVL
jgi:hypothetical protein